MNRRALAADDLAMHALAPARVRVFADHFPARRCYERLGGAVFAASSFDLHGQAMREAGYRFDEPAALVRALPA